MTDLEIPDPRFRQAVAAIDAGEVDALERLLAAHPDLVRQRSACGEGYFERPYLLWFVAENPVRNGTLPSNIVEVARAVVRAARLGGVEGLKEQLDYTLALVCSGRVARECGVQCGLIDLLVDEGASPDCLATALAHREVDAAEQLLQRGAGLTLLAAVCTGRTADAARLAAVASHQQLQLALAGAALYGRAEALRALVPLGVDLDAFSPAGFHPHATALHHAVDSDSLEAVRVLVEAGARLDTRDRVYQGTPLDWAEHLHRAAIADYLRCRGKGR